MVQHADIDHTGITGVGGSGNGYADFCYKTVDESKSSTSYADSTNMALTMLANKVYKFRFVVFYNTNATSVGIKLAIQGPAGALAYCGTLLPFGAGGSGDITIGSNVGASGDISTDLPLAVPATGPGAGSVCAILEGLVDTAATAGDLKLRHASETATATTILAFSHGELIEVA